MVARTASVVDTRALAAEIAELIGPGDVVVLGGDLGAGKTAFTQGLGGALGVTEQIVSPTFTIERVYEGRVTLHHLDVYRLDNLHEALDLGLDEALDDGEVAVVEWGEAISGVLGRDYLLVRLALGAGDDDRTVTFEVHGPRSGGSCRRAPNGGRTLGGRDAGRRRARRARVGDPRRARGRRRRRGWLLMLVLGITTSTPQIGVAVGGHEGVLATWAAVPRPPPRRARHPRDRRGVRERRRRALRHRRGGGRRRAGVVHGPARRRGDRQGDCVGVGCADDRCVEPRPVGVPAGHASRAITAAIDARRGELFVAGYVAVPGGVQRTSEPRTATPDDLAADLLATPGEHLLVGDGAQRYAALLEENGRVELADAGSGYPSRAGPGAARPRTGAARGVGGPGRHPVRVPAPARRRDQLADPRRGRGAMSPQVRAEAPPVEQVAITLRRCAAVTCARCCAIERKVYAKPWTMGLFLGELARRRVAQLRRRQLGRGRGGPRRAAVHRG